MKPRQALVALRDKGQMATRGGPYRRPDQCHLPAAKPSPAPHRPSSYDVHALEACDAGISECDALIAQTGTVLVTNRSAGGRALSVLPPHHVVLARRDHARWPTCLPPLPCSSSATPPIIPA